MEKESSQFKVQSSKFRIAVFASGAGSNAEVIIKHFKYSALASVALVVCNKLGAGVLFIAEKENVATLLIEKEQFFRSDAYLYQLKSYGIDFIVLAGFLLKMTSILIEAYPKRIINIHPALLPKYGGKGMYGKYVHEAVLNAGEKVSGITIHYVDECYDNGDIIFQTACPVLEDDTTEDISRRIHNLEHVHYPRVIEEVLKSLPPSHKGEPG